MAYGQIMENTAADGVKIIYAYRQFLVVNLSHKPIDQALDNSYGDINAIP